MHVPACRRRSGISAPPSLILLSFSRTWDRTLHNTPSQWRQNGFCRTICRSASLGRSIPVLLNMEPDCRDYNIAEEKSKSMEEKLLTFPRFSLSVCLLPQAGPPCYSYVRDIPGRPEKGADRAICAPSVAQAAPAGQDGVSPSAGSFKGGTYGEGISLLCGKKAGL